jgi:hypothetical protein
MREARPRLRMVGAIIGALLILLVGLSPTLLFGEPLTAFGLILLGGSLLIGGMLLRWADGANARTLGTMLLIMGAVLLASGVGLMAALIAGLGWGPSDHRDEMEVS